MTAGYNPQVNDYVIWIDRSGQKHEGWVYFKGEPIPPRRGFPDVATYITIEIGTYLKPDCQYEKNNPHKKKHILLLCYEQDWNQLKLIKKRKSKHDDTIIWTAEKGDV